MRFMIVVLLLVAVAGCKVGDFGEDRLSEYELNRPDCQKTPDRCIDGYPW